MNKSFITLIMLAFLAHGHAQNFSEMAKLVSSDRAAEDNFGFGVAIDGDYAIVGAPYENHNLMGADSLTDAGAVYLLERDGAGNWTEVQKIVASDRGAEDNFGAKVAISGNYAVVAAEFDDEDASGNTTLPSSGSVYVLERDGAGNWAEVQKLVASDRAEEDFFGQSVAIGGNRIIVGAPGEDEDALGANTELSAGSAYIYERDGSGVWNQVQKIVADERAFSDLFGSSVAIEGDIAIVGAEFEDEDANNQNPVSSAGAAYVFERDGSGSWQQVQKLVASDRALTDFFGTNVALSGNYAVLGSNLNDTDESGTNFSLSAGAAYIFERNGNGMWMEVQKIVASDRATNAWFGHNVAISGDRIVIGAHNEDTDESGNNGMSDVGAAYIFERDMNGSWNQTQKIVASDRSQVDWFGYSVGISGNHIIAGAPLEDEDVIGTQSRNNAGSVYIFGDSSIVTSVEDLRTAQNIRLFPNPCIDFIAADGLIGNQTVIIFDAMGRSRVLQSAANGMLDVSLLPRGIYILKFEDEDEAIRSGTFIKY